MLNTIIDISHHQRITSFEKIIDSGVACIIHKATQGTKMVDNKYNPRYTYWKKEKNMLWGSYHFLSRYSSGGEQAKHYIDVTQPLSDELIVIDFEWDNRIVPSLNTLVDFKNEVVKQLNREPVLYTADSIYKDYNLSGYDLWIARYGKAPKATNWKIWQYTDTGIVNGIDGTVDRNYFNGTKEDLYKFWNVSDEMAKAIDGHVEIAENVKEATLDTQT